LSSLEFIHSNLLSLEVSVGSWRRYVKEMDSSVLPRWLKYMQEMTRESDVIKWLCRELSQQFLQDSHL